jgi:hypothetical protein
MLQSSQRESASIFDALGYVTAVMLFGFGIATAHSDPHGLLNLGTTMTLAAALAGVIYLRTSSYRLWQRAAAWARAHRVRLAPLLLAIVLAAIVCVRFTLRLQLGGLFVGTTVALWVCAWSMLLAAVWPAGALRRLVAVLSSPEAIALATVTLIGAGLRFYALGALPNIINGDEGLIGTWAQDVTSAWGLLSTPFAAMDGVGSMYLWLMHYLIAALGPTPLVLRLLPAIAGTLAIPATYLLARQLIGQRGAWVAVGLLAVSHVHLHFSRTVAVSYIYATLFVPLALYCLLSGLERRSAFRLVLSVLFVGLHINTYVDGWVWLVLLGLLLVAWGVADRRLFQQNALPLALFALAVPVIVGPMIVWALMFPAEFSSRLAVDGTFSSGWLMREASATGKTPAQIVLELGWMALTTFTVRPFVDFYEVRVPTLDVVAGPLWVLGLLLTLRCPWERRLLVLNGWFWGGVVALGITTIPPSTYHYRLLVVLPAACIMVGLAVDFLLHQLARLVPALPHQDRWAAATVGVLVIAMAYLNLTTYYGTFASSCMYSGPRTRQAGLLGAYLGTLPHTTRVFVLPTETSFRYGPHRSVDYLSGRMTISNIDTPLDDAQRATLASSDSQGVVVVAVPERVAELAAVRAWLPGGSNHVLTDCGTPVLAAYTWRP